MLTTIGLVIDIILVAAIVICAVVGFVKGFFNSILSFFSFAVCLLIAILCAKYLANGLNHIYNFDGLIGRNIAKAFVKANEYFSLPASQCDINNLPEDLGFWGRVVKVVFKSKDGNFAEGETIASVMGDSLGHLIMVVISAILIFIILKIIIAIINHFIKKATKVKAINVANRIFGLIFGLLKAALIIIVFNVELCFLTLLPPVNKAITPLVQNNTHVEKVIYNKTDKVIEEKFIKGGTLQNWLEDLWSKK